MTEKYKNKFNTKSIRLQNWDYSWNGFYFITICTKNKEKYFGEVKNEKMILNEIGKIAEKFWFEIPSHFPFVKLDAFVLMPNHLHGILIIQKEKVEARQNIIQKEKVETRQNIIQKKKVETRQNIIQKKKVETRQNIIQKEKVETRQNIIQKEKVETRQNIIQKKKVETRHCLVSTGKNRFQNQGKNTISSIIGSYKSVCTKTINKLQDKAFFAWQPRFYDHIIRDTESLQRIRYYIVNNPLQWDLDKYNL